MKKRFYVFSMLAAGMLLAGCSDELEGGQDGPNVVEGVTGYARLALNLPTDGATTRADNDQFADGLPGEYTVNDGIIAFFTGSTTGTDEDATFVRAYSLNDLSNWTPVGGQITTKKVVISEAPIPADGNRIYALVFLNPNGIVTSTNNGLSIGGTPLTASSSKLSDVRKFLTGQNVNAYTKKESAASFFMSNAPLASNEKVGDKNTIKVQTLVPVTVYPTETEAEGANTSDEIYVERAVAKVTLSGFEYDDNGETYTKTVSDDSNIYNDDVVTLEGWVLNKTNKSTAVVRDVTPAAATWSGYQKNSSSYFFGNMRDNLLGSSQYRIYWAVDNNYKDGDTENDAFNVYNAETDDKNIGWNTDAETSTASHPLYCLENTMNTQKAMADDANITYVLLKTTYNFGTGDAGTSFFVVQNAPTQGTMDQTSFLNYVNTQMGYSNTDVLTTIAGDGKIVDTVEEVRALFNLSGPGADDKAKGILAKIGTIKYYKNGSTYYYASYIKHFGDTYTSDPRDPNVTEEKNDANCLGYYGVVRNNWYEININSISGPGEPEITPPNDNYGYINATINILSWAKRQQDVDL